MEEKYSISIWNDFTNRYLRVVVENPHTYTKVFDETVLKEEIDSLYLELKKQYPNSYKCTYVL